MPSQRRWRQRLLGSLQGQLQLATYLVVFAGFTGASTAGLWVGQLLILITGMAGVHTPTTDQLGYRFTHCLRRLAMEKRS